MKKILIVIFSVLIVCVAVFVGVTLSGSLNISSIELVGDMQTVYFVGDDLNFCDAKLKIIYKNGSVKEVNPVGNVEVSLFSTSGHGKYFGTMKLKYKSQVIEQDYIVLDKTTYLISNETKTVRTVSGYVDIDITNSPKRVIEFCQNGAVKYYEISSGKTKLYDGNYEKKYNYKIVGNKISVQLGDKFYNILPTVELNDIILKSNTIEKEDNGFTKYIINTTFESTQLIKTNKTITNTSFDVIYNESSYLIDNINTNTPVVCIYKNKKIDTANLFLNVSYSNGEKFYVHISDEMLRGELLKEINSNESFYINGFYESRQFKINYKIVENI